MKLIKYSKGGASSTNTNTGSGSSGGSTTISSSVELDRTIWGQQDNGGNVDGSMTVNGNVHIKVIIPPTYDPDETDENEDGEDVEVETGGGNLNVELTITSDKTESNEVYAKNHLYVNYPHPNGTKQCVVDLIKNNADKIAANTTNITNLTATVNNHTTQINNLTTTVNNNTTNITNNTTEIENIKSTLEGGTGITEERVKEILNNWKYGDYNRPVILANGKIRKSALTTSTEWFYEGQKLDSISKITLSHKDGLMTMTYTDATNFTNWVYAVHATQMKSGDTGDNVDNTYIKGRSDGAHWFETRIGGQNKIYIREFHEANDDNDTWKSDYWGGDGGGIKEVAITIIGYAYNNN